MKKTIEKIKVMQAYVDGKEIELLDDTCFYKTLPKEEQGKWKTLTSIPRWNWHDCDYRIKK